MKFSIYINQVKALEWGLNIQQSVLFNYLYELPSWAKSFVVYGGVYWWAGKDKIISELPILTDKPDTIKRHMAALEKAGLIERVTYQNHPLIRITEKGKTWNSTSKSEESGPDEGGKIPPRRSGNKRQASRDYSSPYNNTNDSNTKIQNNISAKPSEDIELLFEDFWKSFPTKKSKKQALAKFKSIVKRRKESVREFTDMLCRDVNERVKRCQFGFDKLHPTTYLNQERWTDEHEDNNPSPAGQRSPANRYEEHNQRLLEKYRHTATSVGGPDSSIDSGRMGECQVSGGLRDEVAASGITIDLGSGDFHYVGG